MLEAKDVFWSPPNKRETREKLAFLLTELKERGEITAEIKKAVDAARRRGIRF